MTQALNLANFANNLNTSGATSNAGLQNSAVTVTAGSGLSGGGSVSLGGSVTLNNAGVTSFNGSTGAITFSGGTVSSVATGNGLSGGTITTTGTLSIAAPSFGSVGSYFLCYVIVNNNFSLNGGSFAGSGFYMFSDQNCTNYNNPQSGTWRAMGSPKGWGTGTPFNNTASSGAPILFVRVS